MRMMMRTRMTMMSKEVDEKDYEDEVEDENEDHCEDEKMKRLGF